jgi:DNA-binding transcriptional MerR regulator
MKVSPAKKSYYSISEVSHTTAVKAHVLRYWETQFSMLRPRKSRGGIRQYRPKDVALIGQIKHLLYERGFTIAGARRKLQQERRSAQASWQGAVGDGLTEQPATEPLATDAGDGDQGQREFSLSGPRAGGGLAEIRHELARLRNLLHRPVGSRARSDEP